MPVPQTNATTIKKEKGELSPQEKEKRKDRVLTQGIPSVTQSIAEAIVIKETNLFFLSDSSGNVPLGGNHGFGLYYHDHRYLNAYEFNIADAHPNVLIASASKGIMAILEMTNPEIRIDAGKHIPRDVVGITWERILDDQKIQMNDLFTFKNYSSDPVAFPIRMTFESEFEAVFAIRGLLPVQPGTLHEPAWEDDSLHFSYSGADGIHRNLFIHFSEPPHSRDGTTVFYEIHLEPRSSKQILVSLIIEENGEKKPEGKRKGNAPGIAQVVRNIEKPAEKGYRWQTQVASDSLLFNRLLDRSLQDLELLRTDIAGQDFIAAGVPWFVTLFGRDAIIAALQLLPFDPGLAASTLRLLAQYQGEKVDEWRDEQPGKILHEFRRGELAHLNEIPHTPYYGTVDATPLFLILLAEYVRWTGDLSLFQELEDNVERALIWIEDYGDGNGDGFIEYESMSRSGLINQGWKDSGNALVDADGNLATPPISLVEVQGYVYQAQNQIAWLYDQSKNPQRAAELRKKARDLQERFNREFWSDEMGIYYLALERNNQPLRVVSSNPGHALWSGIAGQNQAQRTMERLMQPDMFNGWGIRTLSKGEKAYNPIGYHLGTVWPHDNAIIASGFRRYGFDQQALQIFNGIVQAAMNFEDNRLPELFAGFSRHEYTVPVPFPVACHPQAWAAGSIPQMLMNLLGIQPQAEAKRLLIQRPLLPNFVDWIEIEKLPVGNSRVDLRFQRRDSGKLTVETMRVDGQLEVEVQE